MNHNLLRLKTVLLFQPPKQTLGKSSQLAYVINNHNFKSVLITALLFQDSMNKVDLGCSGDTPKSGTLSTTLHQLPSSKSNQNQPITFNNNQNQSKSEQKAIIVFLNTLTDQNFQKDSRFGF